ncbi:hypothetical protein FZCC0069_01240 [Rhodobacterales bacterium FZCC0069]|nr:hypothetical protein [Rhodobacterales bacterium FZCC0069]
MKHEANFTATSTQESSAFYDDVILECSDYRIIRGKDSSRYPKQFIVQKFKGGRYRNLTYHVNWDSIGFRHGAWLVNPDDPKISL